LNITKPLSSMYVTFLDIYTKLKDISMENHNLANIARVLKTNTSCKYPYYLNVLKHGKKFKTIARWDLTYIFVSVKI